MTRYLQHVLLALDPIHIYIHSGSVTTFRQLIIIGCHQHIKKIFLKHVFSHSRSYLDCCRLVLLLCATRRCVAQCRVNRYSPLSSGFRCIFYLCLPCVARCYRVQLAIDVACCRILIASSLACVVLLSFSFVTLCVPNFAYVCLSNVAHMNKSH